MTILTFFYSGKGPSWGPQRSWGPTPCRNIYEFSRVENVVRKYKKLLISEIVDNFFFVTSDCQQTKSIGILNVNYL